MRRRRKMWSERKDRNNEKMATNEGCRSRWKRSERKDRSKEGLQKGDGGGGDGVRERRTKIMRE